MLAGLCERRKAGKAIDNIKKISVYCACMKNKMFRKDKKQLHWLNKLAIISKLRYLRTVANEGERLLQALSLCSLQGIHIFSVRLISDYGAMHAVHFLTAHDTHGCVSMADEKQGGKSTDGNAKNPH